MVIMYLEWGGKVSFKSLVPLNGMGGKVSFESLVPLDGPAILGISVT